MLQELVPVIIIPIVSLVLFLFFRHRTRVREQLLESLRNSREDIQKASDEFEKILNSELYISKASYSAWIEGWKHLRPIAVRWKKSGLTEKVIQNELGQLYDAFENGEAQIREHNENYIKEELEKFKQFFDSVEEHPLTDSQRKAIVTDEKHNLIVAGAGTGKTSTIVGKAGYLIQRGLAEPDEVLLIAFARKARDEMKGRVRLRLGLDIRVETFHSFGLSILKETEGRAPSVSELSRDKLKLQNTIERFVQKKVEDQGFLRKLNNYFAYHKTPHRSQFHFNSMGEYIDYLRNNQVRSLKGELVKSLEECEIANFLFMNGIEYVYEAKYEIHTVTPEHLQYKPDFFLPKYNIYIEHFGVDKNGKTAPFVDRQKYLAGMRWKRSKHKANRTKLIETYSWEKSDGVLLENLEGKLLTEEVEFNEVSPQDVFKILNEMGLIHPFAGLLSTFLNLFKSSRKSIGELRDQAKTRPNAARYLAFLDIFSAIYDDYGEALGDEVDFNDMILGAEKSVRDGRYVSNYRYILVDEFQDISYSRYSLLKALVDQNPESKLFCVGDDWQSIYRFTGSDIFIMTEFDNYFSPSEHLELDLTFRFDNQLCDFSTKFILENPNQIQKKLQTDRISDTPSVTLWLGDTGENILPDILSKIIPLEHKRPEVQIIGRYNHQIPENLDSIRHEFPMFDIYYSTAHSSKGTQADFVILLGLNSGRFAFPSEIEDDPVLDMVLAKQDSTPNAEERRLFYVAVTRAKKHVFLVADKKNPSSFASEIERQDYNVNIYGKGSEPDIHCPQCKTGVMTLRRGEFGQFYSCSNYPYCRYRPRMCIKCGKGMLIEGEVDYLCSNDECSFRASKCPLCNDGYLVERQGPYSKFLGCINYPRCSFSRSYGTRSRRRR